MALGRQRAREAKLTKIIEGHNLEARVDEALSRISDAYPRSREARATWLELEAAVGRDMLLLAADRLLLREVAARTGLPPAECRRLMRHARVSAAPQPAEGGRY
jgi:hypothetical protein